MIKKMDVLLESLYKYYSNKKNMNSLLDILENNTKVSLRIIDWFATNYSKKNNIFYSLTVGNPESAIASSFSS